ncbi:DNA cytosine methyltransferase [Streptomyces sp. H39-S7]|nr:DNA cytosine methyltransferase [Streptomyces sp. H39-S7]MCZ4122697.1 DNA cytosine methyltransferase [Streptomyces sp. H39-S7]
MGGRAAWHAEINPDASRILARHWPGVPNLGDITAVNWDLIPRVCVLTAGFPCQRRLRCRPSSWAQCPHPLRAVAARRACGRSPPPLPGGDRECPRPPHLARRFPWRRGILPVVSGRHRRPASFASTRCRTRLPGRPPVRRAMARASRLRRRSPAPPRAGLPRRLAHRKPCSRPRRATSAPTAARSTRRSANRAGTGRTWPPRWSGCCCRPQRHRTGSRARRTSGTATAT